MLSSPEDGENKFPEGALDLNYNLEDKNNLSGSPIMNVSHISEMEKNKVQANSAKKKEIKEEKKSDSKNKNNNKKKYDDIPDLLIDIRVFLNNEILNSKLSSIFTSSLSFIDAFSELFIVFKFVSVLSSSSSSKSSC